MNPRNIILASALVLGLVLPAVVRAQGPLYDKVIVDLPYTVSVGDHVLQPGDYVIRQLPSSGGSSHVLLIYSDNGTKFETSAITIPALDNSTPEDTKVVLHHFGNDYYFDKIWVQGKNYGYEFPLPESVKSRERERQQPLNVAARYEAAPAPQVAEAAPPPAPAPAPAPEPQAQPQTQAPPPEAAPAPAPEAAPAPAPVAATAEQPKMPATAANWLLMLLAGGGLSGAGLALRRRL